MLPRAGLVLVLATALLLGGCEMLSGNDKAKDGESIGYACRLSSKLPEDCMKENDGYTPTSVLEGWKRADKEVKEGKVGPPAKPPAQSQSASEAKAETSEAPAEPPGAEKLVPETKPVPEGAKP